MGVLKSKMDSENIGELGALAPLSPCQNSVRVSPNLYYPIGRYPLDLVNLNIFASYLELSTGCQHPQVHPGSQWFRVGQGLQGF